MNFIRYTSCMLFLGFNLSSLGFSTSVHAEELNAAPTDSFSIVVIPDTQQYRGGKTKKEPDSEDPVTNPTFAAWTDWIIDNLDRQKVVFVSHVGDIVDHNQASEWEVAREHMDKLHGRVPYGISVGNHDMVGKSGDSSLFQDYFPKSRFEEFDWYGGCLEKAPEEAAVSGNNANSYQLFEAGGMRFVILHLECNAPDEVLEWADSILTKHADRRAIVTSHMGLGPEERPKKSRDYFDAPKGRMKWSKCHDKRGNTPQQMWKKCFKKHANLFLICCGDQSRTQAMRKVSQGKAGNQVHELLSDYGTNGLRLLRFHPAENEIEVVTWDPIKGERCLTTSIVPDQEQHQFTLQYEMAGVPKQ
ncbi:hypothetical protein Pla110_41320 [Polystyrenella longa]|uniref:Calcineurin-like phosphoesterase domain-containing protein n=1 Tax=Polystyrenella longa TaxID=2528007 RepID=A0A518CT22_9PLAN|nr:metallophosphoesterase [Polystyrenella longa]QDU82377.1 hypothetical protein Pla110_41320 [Polystyrenella longa]